MTLILSFQGAINAAGGNVSQTGIYDASTQAALAAYGNAPAASSGPSGGGGGSSYEGGSGYVKGQKGGRRDGALRSCAHSLRSPPHRRPSSRSDHGRPRGGHHDGRGHAGPLLRHHHRWGRRLRGEPGLRPPEAARSAALPSAPWPVLFDRLESVGR